MKRKTILNKGEKNICFNSLPHKKILDWSKLKAFVDDKRKVTEKLKFLLGRVENTVGKGEISQGRQKYGLCGNGLNKKTL